MKFLSMFSGIDAASVAWRPLGWEAAAFCEIEKFPSAVLAHHYPKVPNLGDVTKANFNEIGPIDVAVFGSPCQSFSIAGKRLGLDDPRGNLALVAGKVVYRKRPRWFVFENVPGLLSSDDGRDFGTLIAAFAGYPSGSIFSPPESGWGNAGVVVQADSQSYGLAWRILDAQHFGVPQRRRRVFVVGHLGDWRRAAAVLFERESLQGNPAPRREKGQEPAGFTDDGATGCREIAGALTSNYGKQPDSSDTALGPNLIAHFLRGEGFDASEDGTGRGTPLVPVAIQERAVSENIDAGPQGKGWQENTAYTLEARNKVQAVAYAFKAGQGSKAQGIGWQEECAPTLSAGESGTQRSPGLLQGSAVRRLTPRECERLQGFPDDYTQIPWRGKDANQCPDGPRYKALGNSMAVPCMSWLGQRIKQCS